LDNVADVIREVAAEVIEPRWASLNEGEIWAKSPGEAVTVADEEAEALLAVRLRELLPGTPVVGEEACSARPELLSALGSERAWLVDPLDGTANFIAGSPDWAVMVALVERGLTVASWIWRPVGKVMYIAEKGSGATRNGVPLAHPGSPREPAEMRGAVLARFLDEGTAALVANNACQFRSVLPGRMCAGAEYPAVVEDEQDFALFWRTLPWDHAPGALLANEAGLSARRPDGSAYEPGRPGTGLLVAAGEANWQTVRGALLGPRPPTNSGRPADVNC
jgi:fructose-1,6-bisphosphatase/inositol monophosphatase family enzyme